MKRYSIARKDGGVMYMTAAEGVNPLDEIAKWPPQTQALVDPNGIAPIDEIPPERLNK